MTPTAFVLYGYNEGSALQLRTWARALPRVRDSRQRDGYIAEGRSFYIDASCYAFAVLKDLREDLTAAGARVRLVAQPKPLPRTISESWIRQQSTYGLVREFFGKQFSEVRTQRAVAALIAEAEGGGEMKPPTEADRVKERQERENLATKQRQGNELLQAKERDLQKKTREKQSEIGRPKTPTA